MTKVLSDEEVFEAAPGVAKGAKVLSDEEVFGGEDAFDKSVKGTVGSKALQVGKDVLGYTAGTASQIEDMLISTANIFGLPGSWATSTYALAKGEKPDVAAKAALGFREQFLPAWLNAPFGKIAEAMGPEEKSYYDENGIGWVMKHFGEGVEKGSKAVEEKTGLPAEYLQLVAGQAMDLLGAKGVKAGVKDASGRYETAAQERVMANQRRPTEINPDEVVSVKPGEVGDLAAAEDAKILRDQIDERMNIKDPATEAKLHGQRLKEIKSAFKDDPAGAKQLEALANRRMEQSAWQLVQEAERLGRTDPDAKLPVDWTEVNDIVQKPGYLRTPEEQIRLRQYARGIGANAPKGAIDPELLSLLAGGATGAALATYFWSRSDAEVEKRRIRELNREQDRQDNLPPNDILPPERLWENQQRRRLNPVGSNAEDVAGALIPLAAGAFGAIRPKGVGSWHPEAVERLAAPLRDKLGFADNMGAGLDAVTTPAERASHPAAQQADRMIRTWLNKHAGTATDPLKDVEIPFGQRMERWETLTDAAAFKDTAESFGIKSPKPEETVYHFDERPSFKAIKDHLSHVGDYLREHVSPEKLQQYDLVRAVKETAAWDKELAKNMEKARLDDTKGSPVYKDYGDGMRWVQLTKPGQFARESDVMGHSVRGYEPPKTGTPQSAIDWYNFEAPESIRQQYPRPTNDLNNAGHRWTEALRNTPEYKEFRAAANRSHPDWTPEAGASGHPSYGLGGWDAIKRGDAKIYSLRDGKGNSHVTIEVDNTPGQYKGYPSTVRNALLGPSKADLEYKPPNNNNILQIKGKQNRAPSSDYLPYVQDFVKGGKWGEVGDLGNTGLIKHKGEMLTTKEMLKEYEALPEEIQKTGFVQERMDWLREGSNREYDYSDGLRYAEGFLRNQRGSVDPKLLAGLGVAATGAAAGAYVDSEKPWRGAILGGAAPFALNALRKGQGLDYVLGATSTRLGNISPALKLKSRDFERNVLKNTESSLNEVDPFLKGMSQVKGEKAKELDAALMANDTHAIAEAIKGNPELVTGWRKVQNLLRSFEDTQKSLGRFKEGLSGYFPRIVKDLDGLKEALGTEQRTSLETALMKAEAKMLKEKQRPLTDVEKSIIIDRSLNSEAGISHLPGYAHGRRVKEVTDKLRPFYADPKEALLRYISAAVQDAETAKFFGKDLATKTRQGKLITDIDASIGKVVESEMSAGRMKAGQADELRSLLHSRFDGGEKSMSGPLQDVRNVANIGLLGSFHSAATQIGDSVMTVYHHGMLPTMKAAVQKVTGQEVSTKEFGLAQHIMEELGSARLSGKSLQTVFKLNGFSAIDQFAKGLNLNAGLIKNRNLAKTEKGLAKLQEKYGTAFGEEFPELVKDLKSGKVTDRVRSLLFSELSDAQPITKMEMPQAYLDHPNGRILFQMKTYMIKQMDVVRRDAYNEIKAGNVKEGLKNLAGLSTALALSNVPGDIVKDFLSGRKFDIEKIDMVENLLRNFGISRYSIDQVSKGKATDVAWNMVKPPAGIIGEAAKLDAKSVKYIPLAGKAVYDRYLGGNEAKLAQEKKQERREARDVMEKKYPILKQQRLLRKERAEERKREKLRREM